MCPWFLWSVILILFEHPKYSTTEGGVAVPLWVAKKGCASALGLYDGQITDSQLSASSSHSVLSTAKYARLNSNDGFGAWCPNQSKKMYPNQKGGPYYDQYLQVDFGRLQRVHGIRTQGRTNHGGHEKVEKYRLNYTRLGIVAKQFISREGNPKLFEGNKDAGVIKDQWLDHTVVASSIRIVPQIYQPNQVCLRLELYGCNWPQGIISYTMPQGNILTLKGIRPLVFQDNIYDGIVIDKTLSAGMGVLTDITFGSKDVRHHKGWIGWNRNLVTAPYIVFEFEKQRIFRSVTFYCNLRDSYNITVFSDVKVGSSMTASKFDSMIKYETPVLSSGKFYRNYNATVDICGATGKYVKCEFSYRADWILISEVTFDSEVAGVTESANLGCAKVTFPTATSSTKGISKDEPSTEPLNVTVTVSGRKDGTDTGLIAGIVCGTLVFIMALLGVACWWRYKNWKLHGEKPFNHFIKIEVRPPYNAQSSRVSRLSSCAEERIDPDVELCPVYASIADTEKVEANTYEEPPLAKTGTNTRKPSGSDMKKPPRNSVKKPTKPPPGPPVLVNGTLCSSKDAGPEKIPELYYAEPATPSTPLLNEDPDSKDTFYAEPESPTIKGPQLQAPVLSLPRSSNGKQKELEDGYYAEPESPKEKLPLIDFKIPKTKSKTSKKNKNKGGFEPVNPAKLDRPVEQPVAQAVKPPVSGYAEPIDAVNKNNTDELFQNPVYEEVYSEPFQGVSGTSLYANPSDELARADTITEFPREKLKFREKIGDGQFGEVHIGEAEDLEEFFGLEPTGSTTTVAIKVLKTDVAKDIKEDFFKEVKIMSRLKHENVVQLLGVCKDDPMLMIVEYMVNGDLNQFLSERRLGSGSEVHSDMVLAYQALLYMAMQVSSGMKYISSLNYVHRDLATRNLLVGHSFTVKIADFGMSRNTYCKHYYRIRGKAILPIRWMAPECILQGKFTTESDVWSFGVTLWEILTLARYPYSEISDEKVIENVQKIFYDVSTSEPIIYLEKPVGCQADVYEMMRSCWCRVPSDRPTFDRLHSFLKKHVKLSEITI